MIHIKPTSFSIFFSLFSAQFVTLSQGLKIVQWTMDFALDFFFLVNPSFDISFNISS